MQDTPHLTQRHSDNGTAHSAQERAALRPSNPARDQRPTIARNQQHARAQIARSRCPKSHPEPPDIPRSSACEAPFGSALRAPLISALPGRRTSPANERSHSQNRPFFHRPYPALNMRSKPASSLRRTTLFQQQGRATKSTLRTAKSVQKQARQRAAITARTRPESNTIEPHERSVR